MLKNCFSHTNPPVSTDQIASTICAVRSRYVSDGLAPSYLDINSGLCDDFAREVVESLGGKTDKRYSERNRNFSVDGDQWNTDFIPVCWGIAPLVGLIRCQAVAIDFGSHVWLTDGVRHFDAECPHGVLSFFDLPIFERFLVQEQCFVASHAP